MEKIGLGKKFKLSVGAKIILTVVGLILTANITGHMLIAYEDYRDARDPVKIAAKAVADKKAAAEKKANDKIDAIEQDSLHETCAVTYYLTQNLKDPKSFSAVKAVYMVDTGDVFIIYRARNSFGGMNFGYAYSNKKENKIYSDVSKFNRELKKAKGFRIDVTAYSNA